MYLKELLEDLRNATTTRIEPAFAVLLHKFRKKRVLPLSVRDMFNQASSVNIRDYLRIKIGQMFNSHAIIEAEYFYDVLWSIFISRKGKI